MFINTFTSRALTTAALLLGSLWSMLLYADATQVKVVSRGDDNANYAIAMLKLGLSKLNKRSSVNVTDGAWSASKLREELNAGSIDVIWTATSKDMEQSSLPIRVPLFKGLLGHRIFIISRRNEHLFDNIDSFSQVKKYRFGQGKGWPDTTIMETNGLNVITAPKYESLFYMTDGDRFDAFPRGVHEPWGEVASRQDLNLSVDKNLMFVYLMPYYLFVTPKRPQLAKDLEWGLKRAIDDGSFDELFLNNTMVKMVIKNANLSHRKVFQLDNPELPPNTPLDNAKLWVDTTKL